jgi:hypothetical protein
VFVALTADRGSSTPACLVLFLDFDAVEIVHLSEYAFQSVHHANELVRDVDDKAFPSLSVRTVVAGQMQGVVAAAGTADCAAAVGST